MSVSDRGSGAVATTAPDAATVETSPTRTSLTASGECWALFVLGHPRPDDGWSSFPGPSSGQPKPAWANPDTDTCHLNPLPPSNC